MRDSPFTSMDRRQLEQHGITEADARRQLELFQRPARYAALVRPCVPGDGIDRLDEARATALASIGGDAAAAGNRLKFVPASGAATRMFRDLLQLRRDDRAVDSWRDVERHAAAGGAEARTLLEVRDRLPRFAFYEDLRSVLAGAGFDVSDAVTRREPALLLDALLSSAGLGYAALPKGLLKFHRYDGGRHRTSFEEHLVEAAQYARDAHDRCRLHLTVSPEHRERFAALFDEVRTEYERMHGVEYEVTYSEQRSSTDTLAVDLDNRPFRDAAGRLLLRPGGHGALIHNLNEVAEEVVFIKNIDNVQPDHAREPTVRWKRVLAGYLLALQAEVFKHYRRVRGIAEVGVREYPAVEILDSVMSFVQERLHVGFAPEAAPTDPAERRRFLLDRLRRPLRVCGVVPNTGEPGGGPFWVRGADGTIRPQIVESAEVDPESAEQQDLLRRSTHFSPVDLVCGLRDADGNSFDLHEFVDREAVIVSRKSAAGRDLKALERPGLWNGAMAGWNTAFVEVPLQTFTPVKTVLDLLRDEHLPGRAPK